MDSCLNRMLICGFLMAALQGTNGSKLSRSRKDQILRANIRNLQEHYNTLGAEWVGNSVFVYHLEQLQSKGSCTCQSMLLERMLNVYEDIFTDMLKKSEKEELKSRGSSVKDILTEVQNLRQRYSEEQKLWRELLDINSIKVENGTIRGTALNEFLMVFDLAFTEKQHNRIH